MVYPIYNFCYYNFKYTEDAKMYKYNKYICIYLAMHLNLTEILLNLKSNKYVSSILHEMIKMKYLFYCARIGYDYV